MTRLSASFRDPCGYVFEQDGTLYRAIHESGRAAFEHYMGSGLHMALQQSGQIVDVRYATISTPGAWKTLEVVRLPFISYPYEWSFSQLKAAALLTLDIQLEALERGMILKDASAYNVQFNADAPVFIDTLSFDLYREGMPWEAYRQFVMHFLGPLLLMAKVDVRHALQLRNFVDGLPLDYVSRHLPVTSWFSLSSLVHVHLHARMQARYSDTRQPKEKTQRAISRNGMTGLVKNLRAAVERLSLPARATEWGDYYNDTNYSVEAFAHKQEIVSKIAVRFAPKKACDLGANDGRFSHLIAQHAGFVVAADVDPVAVDHHYRALQHQKITNCLPLLQDLFNPSPSLGWAAQERDSFIARAEGDFAMGLALIHHLCIGGNIPLGHVAALFYRLAPVALVEFVPKEDSQAQRLLASRKDIFSDYTQEECIRAFREHYAEVEVFPIRDSKRSLLLFTARK